VVVGIIGLLFALVVPAFTGISRGQGMRSAVTQLRTTTALARQWAVTRNERTYVVFPGDTLTYNRTNVTMAYRSYAVWAERSGYVSEWRRLPVGVVFDPTPSLTNNLFNGSANPGDKIISVPFPMPTSSSQQVFAIAFMPNGRLKGESWRSLFLREGWVDVDTNAAAVLGVQNKPSSTYQMELEFRPLTGGVRIYEL